MSKLSPLQRDEARCAARHVDQPPSAIGLSARHKATAGSAAECGKQFNERSAGLLNRAQYPSDVIALVVLWRLRYKLSLRDLAEMFLTRGFVFSYEAVREWEAKLTPALAENLRRRRKGQSRAAAGTSMRHTSECVAVGGICIARSIATAPWST